MKSNFLILIGKVHEDRFDIEFINKSSSLGSYYYSIKDNQVIKYKVFNYKDIPDNSIVKTVKTKSLFYEE